MSSNTAARVTGTKLFFIPIKNRVPLKFGAETLVGVTVARACVRIEDGQGRVAIGWGETPLSVQWVWPAASSLSVRHDALNRLTLGLGQSWAEWGQFGHPIELGCDFIATRLPGVLSRESATLPAGVGPIPFLAGLVCCSVFDQAVHDAYGNLHGLPVYETYNQRFMTRSLGDYLEPATGSSARFDGVFPDRFLSATPSSRLRAWHLVGGLDPLGPGDLTGSEPDDGYPVLLEDWIRTDGLTCLKVKLRGTDADWDYRRIVEVGRIGVRNGVEWLTADFNCTVLDPAYVTTILDRLRDDEPRISGMLLYVEQPFPYELDEHNIDVRAVSARKPLFLDESAHDWRMVRRGRELGWTGVALKTCKTQSGAILSACWARAHGMTLMVQDLSNPMLAQVPHLLLAAHVGTIMGVETNSMQFYPAASLPEARVHPGLHRRSGGCVDLGTLRGSGFGYRVGEIDRVLPDPACVTGVV